MPSGKQRKSGGHVEFAEDSHQSGISSNLHSPGGYNSTNSSLGSSYSTGFVSLASSPGRYTRGSPVYINDQVLKQVGQNQSKFIQERISLVEKHFGELCTGFGNYVRRCTKMRDSGDELSKALMGYAEQERLNHTTKYALKDMAENFSGIQDYRETQIKRLDGKVMEPLTLYGQSCKHAKERLKAAFSAREKEMKKKKSLDKTKDHSPSDRHQIAESDLQRAQVDVSYTSKQLEEEMDGFEKKKLEDIKRILSDFINVEMVFHAKALELYTRCFQALNTMSEEEDLEEFRNSLRPPSARTRQEMQHAASKTSLNTTSGTSRATPTHTPTASRRGHLPSEMNGTSTMNSTTFNTTGQSMYSDTLDDDDDDDDFDETTEEPDTYEQRMIQAQQRQKQQQQQKSGRPQPVPSHRK